MGEHEQRRAPGEIIEVYRRPIPCPGRLPGEIVEVYRQPDRREVAESYSRPLPQGHTHAGEGRRSPQEDEMPDLLTDLFPSPAPKRARRTEDPHFSTNPRSVPLRQKKKRKTGLWVFLFCIGLALGITVTIQMIGDREPSSGSAQRNPFEHFAMEREPDSSQPEEITIPDWPTGQGVAMSILREHGEALTAQEVYRQVNPSVVTVMVDIDRTRMSVGTGVIFTEDGYLITNHHVVAGGRDCVVVLNTGRSCQARYVASDEKNDLAVLKIAPADIRELGPLTPAQFGDSDLLSVGDPAYAIGNPLGWELRGTLTDGIVSAINRDVNVDGRTMTLIQTNAALNSGNSGGPLINQYGQVVGINVIKMSSRYSTVEGLGFAIPSALMERMVNDLLERGEITPEPSIGVSVLLTAETLADGSRGLEVKTVEPDSAASRAGVREGDYILRAAGEALNTSQDLLRVRRHFHIGDEMTLSVWRDGEVFDVTLELLESAD